MLWSDAGRGCRVGDVLPVLHTADDHDGDHDDVCCGQVQAEDDLHFIQEVTVTMFSVVSDAGRGCRGGTGLSVLHAGSDQCLRYGAHLGTVSTLPSTPYSSPPPPHLNSLASLGGDSGPNRLEKPSAYSDTR